MGVAIMYKTGLYLMGVALALAFLGIFFSDPSGQMPDRLNLFRMALRGLEVQMIRLSADPPRYLVRRAGARLAARVHGAGAAGRGAGHRGTRTPARLASHRQDMQGELR
ncbi:hypothetical protein [Cupriavidus pauculus]|uniref:hypothetical protein n=1 Tax=Cupriavidus pauculus TaxID=82633 RepID=UPI001D0CB7CE|nr:hypothetical protein [Cupriavidus pauculus]